MSKATDDDAGVPGSRSGTGSKSVWNKLVLDGVCQGHSLADSPTDTRQTGTGPSVPGNSARRDRYTILVVDDTAAARYAVARVLRYSGFMTREAADATTALKMAEFVDAVVLDVNLPDLSGLEICRMLRTRPKTKSMPLLLVSNVFVEQADEVRAREAGANAYFLPPIDGLALAETLDLLLSRPAP